MRLLIHCLLCIAWSLSPAVGQDKEVATLEQSYAESEKAYLQQLYQAQKPLLEKRLKKLKEWKTRAASENQTALVEQIDTEITAVKTEIANAAKALRGVKKIPLPLKPKAPDTHEAQEVAVDFAQAEVAGGVIYDPTTKSLTGWKSRQATATLPINVREGVIYTVKLIYSSTDKGRIKVAIDHLNFLPNLKNTGGSKERVTLDLGEFKSEKPTATLSIGLPIHRSKEFVQLRGMRLVPHP